MSGQRKVCERKLVLFGAGRIGRSFIGQLFSRSGYEVVFVDKDKKLIEAINRKKQYKIIIKSDKKDQVLTITNIRGVLFNDTDNVTGELTDASIAAISVGQSGLPVTIPVLTTALLKRRELFGNIPLDIIIAENMRNADQFLYSGIKRLLPADYQIDELVGFVETSIGKMVPIMTEKDLENDPLQVFAEPYNTLIVAKKGFRNPVPEVLDLDPKENMKAWVDRKLFIHNLGHATAAYLGFLKYPKAVYIYEVLEDKEILYDTWHTMMQSADILMSLHPGEFTKDQLSDHINDLLYRFRNKALGDTLFRVGCDLYRKLSPGDRLVAPIKAAMDLNKPFDLILKSLISAISFRGKNESGRFLPSDEAFLREAEKGTDYILKTVCDLNLDIYTLLK